MRASHAFPPERISEALIALYDYEAVREAAMLQTCGRLEIYAEVDDFESGVTQIKRFLGNFRHSALDYDIESYLYTMLGRAACEHLFRVTTGLDSMLIGEAEILAQVKDAFVRAQHAHSLGQSLHRLFRDAMTAGKEARSKTTIGASSASVATAAVEIAKTTLGGLLGKTVAIVGAGKMGRAAVLRLRDEGVKQVIVANRTHVRTRALLDEIGFGDAVDFAKLDDALARADAVVTSTGASHFVLTSENVGAAMERRPNRPLLIVDIAVPRDADPAVAQIDGVSLVDIDGLKSVVDSKLGVRRDAIPEVERIIARQLTRFDEWYRARAAIPVIASLTQKAELIREQEVERLLARIPHLSSRERELVVGSTMKIVSRLLHDAIERVRARAISQPHTALAHARILDELFDLELADDVKNAAPFTEQRS